MAIFAILNTKNQEDDKYIFEQLEKGYARFGWSYRDEHDLRAMEDMSWEKFDEFEENNIEMYEPWNKSYWLLTVKIDDYFVYINQPAYSLCTVVRITGSYRFDRRRKSGDFRHVFSCEKIGVFNRNHAIAVRIPYASLRPRSRYQRIYQEDVFEEIIEKLSNAGDIDYTLTSDNIILSKIDDFSEKATKFLLSEIKSYFAQKQFEDFIMQILQYQEGLGTIRNSHSFKGVGTEKGCDIKFEYYNPLLSKFETVILQLKAYNGMADVAYAIENLSKYLNLTNDNINQALILTTAENIDLERYEVAKKKFESEFRIPVSVLYGKNMLAWIFRYGTDMLFSNSDE